MRKSLCVLAGIFSAIVAWQNFTHPMVWGAGVALIVWAYKVYDSRFKDLFFGLIAVAAFTVATVVSDRVFGEIILSNTVGWHRAIMAGWLATTNLTLGMWVADNLLKDSNSKI